MEYFNDSNDPLTFFVRDRRYILTFNILNFLVETGEKLVLQTSGNLLEFFMFRFDILKVFVIQNPKTKGFNLIKQELIFLMIQTL